MATRRTPRRSPKAYFIAYYCRAPSPAPSSSTHSSHRHGPGGGPATGPRWIGIEREPAYAKVARARIDATLPLDESAMTMMADKRAAPRVAFGLLVESGMVPPGSLLSDGKRRWTATVGADGSIASGPHRGSIHQVGAALQGAPSCNGWAFWHIDVDGVAQPIDTLRQAHLQGL